MSFVTHFVTASPATYAIVFGVVAIDALLPFAQAEAVVITASVLAAHGDLLIWPLIPIVAVAGFVGDNASYLLGRHVGGRSQTGSIAASAGRRGSSRRRSGSGIMGDSSSSSGASCRSAGR